MSNIIQILIKPYLSSNALNNPTAETMRLLWKELSAAQQGIATQALKTDKVMDVVRETKFQKKMVVDALTYPPVANVVFIGYVLQQKTQAEKDFLLEHCRTPGVMPPMTETEVRSLIEPSENYMAQIAEKLPSMSGDGKRQVLKRLVAYGMQEKMVESEARNEDGSLSQEAIYGLADPKIAMSAVQELNKMDHEYGEDDKATSSVESQAQRIRRLAKSAKKIAGKQLKQSEASVERIAARAIREDK